MKILIGLIITMLSLSILSTAFAKEVTFTQDDRDRLIRLETKVDGLQKQIDDLKASTQKQIDDLKASTQKQIDDLKAFMQKQIDDSRVSTQKQIDDSKASTQKQIDDLKASTNKQIDNLRVLMLWGFGILFGGMGILIGFVIWDRRTALAPAIRKNRELEEKEERIERALKELAKKDPNVAEALKHAGLL
ncbi:MAG: hypothetical protein D6828_05425 [Nitrospirae bacterium]|nr:MAG: hypothetical protein D6828_05425 [Nitrospirota bacterium]